MNTNTPIEKPVTASFSKNMNNSQKFVLAAYPNATCQCLIIYSENLIIGFGNTTESAWDDAFMKILYKGLR